MKNIFCLILFIFILTLHESHSTTFTYNPIRHQIRLGSGFPNMPYLFTVSVHVALLLPLYFQPAEFSFLGPIIIYYDYTFHPKWSVGCFYHYSSVSAKYFDFKTGNEMGLRTNFYNNISANINYHFLNPGRLDLYSGISAGYTLILRTDDNDNEKIQLKNLSEFFYQINGIGCRWIFANHFAAYGEIGIGWNGILMGGLSYIL